MLEPEYFYGKSNRMVEMYQELEDWILQDIANRLLKCGDLSATADRELWKLEQMGLHKREIIKRLSQLTGKSRNEVRRLLKDSAMTSFASDMDVLKNMVEVIPLLKNNDVILAMNAELTKTMGELGNLTRTTMMQSQSDLLKLLNEVDFRVAAGLQSYSSAVCEVLDRYAAGGVMVNYPTGARRSLEAAVRCCVVTSMNQAAAEVTNQYIIQNNVEYVVVSEHLGARYNPKDPTGISSHDWWQGKAYKIHGSEPGFPNLLECTGYDIDFTAKRGVCVNLLGLHGYNCRHSHGPWYKELGTRRQKKNKEESQKRYDLEQQQRAIERAVRKTKRQLLVKEQELKAYPDDPNIQSDYDKLTYKLRAQNQKYNEFCKENDLQKQYDRVKVVEFKKEQVAKANGRATAYGNAIQNDVKKSGATSGAVYNYKNDPDGSKRYKIAENLYSQTRNRNIEHEVKAVAKNSGMSESDIRKIYNHIYVNPHLFHDGTTHLFDPDYEMAQSWQRLRNNVNIQPHDITLLKHELAEYNVMGESLDIEYEAVHNEVVKTYNYQKELIQYLKERGRE